MAGKEENDRVWTGPSEEDPTYRLLVDCNQLAVDIDNEIGIIHNFMRDKYRLKFPELESLVHHPIDYARVVQAIGKCLLHLIIKTFGERWHAQLLRLICLLLLLIACFACHFSCTLCASPPYGA